MKIETEHHQWLNDPEGHRRSRSASDRFASEWNSGPVHAAFVEAIAGLPYASGESIASAVATLFETNQALDAAITALVAALRADPMFEPPFRRLNSDIHEGLLLFEDGRVAIAAGVTSLLRLAEKKCRGTPGSIIFSGQLDVFKFVRAGGARLAFWEASPVSEDFTATAAGRCRLIERKRVEEGEICIVDGRRRSFIIEHASANLVLLQATVKADRAPVSVEYDAATGTYLGCSAADDSASRIQMLATLLRKLDGKGAFEAIAEFLGHPSFFVRWHVMRELLGLDVEAALPHLRRMAATDPHSENRRAARSVLERIEAGAGRKAA